MKTIFITITRGLIARNILRTDVLKILKLQPDIKIVVFVPKLAAPFFREEFGGEKNIIIEEALLTRRTWFRKNIFTPLLKGLILTKATEQLELLGTGFKKKNNAARYYLYICFFGILSKLHFLKKVFQWLEFKLYPDKEYEIFFDKYAPDLVFTTTVFSLLDIAMNKVARRRGVPSVGMPKSWDVLGKYLLPANPNKMLVQNEYLRSCAVKYHLFKPENVTIVGFPQFDIYADQSVFLTREEFCKKMGISPEHKIIFFGSEGPASPHDEDIIDIIVNFMQKGELKHKCSLIIRPHPRDAHLRRFDKFKNISNVFVNDYKIVDYFPDHWNPTREEINLFANVLYHSDVTINSFSTLSLDAACLDKPIVSIGFDGYKKITTSGFSALVMYRREYYKDIGEKKANRLAKSAEELREFINIYLSDPSADRNEREVLRKSSCYFDDSAGRRIAQFLLLQLGYN